MINFRFHLVSLTAVFLALAAGIAIGAGVVDRQTVGFLEDRLRTVENNRDETNALNDKLRAELDVWGRFADEAGDRILAGTLPDAPLVVVAVEGTDRGLVDRTRTALGAAGAAVHGTVWFTERWLLDSTDDGEALASLTDSTGTARPAELRDQALASLVSTWQAGAPGELLLPLRDAGFLELDPPADGRAPVEQTSLALARVVLLAADSSQVPSAQLAVPLARHLADAGVAVVAAEPTAAVSRDGESDDSAEGAASAVRRVGGLAARVTTVDNVDDPRGRLALAWAIADLAAGRRGHYGTGEGADRLLPETPG